MISAIAALGKNRVLGKNNELLWPIPDDLKRFKHLTMGHPIIMGRKTYESIGKPLPGRTNIVVTRNSSSLARFDLDNKVVVANSLEEGVEKARALDTKEIFIMGGAQIYEQALPFIDRLYLTLIDAEAPTTEKEELVYFPAYEEAFTKIIHHEHRDYEGLQYKWVDLEK